MNQITAWDWYNMNYADSMQMLKKPETKYNVCTLPEQQSVIIRDYYELIWYQRLSTEVIDGLSMPDGGLEKLKILLDSITTGTFIYVDSDIGGGNIEFANALCTENGYILFDVNKRRNHFISEWIREHGNCVDVNFVEERENYVFKRIEEQVLEESKNGSKTLVFCEPFSNLVPRIITAHTLGRYFSSRISVTLHDKVNENYRRFVNRERITQSQAPFMRVLIEKSYEELEMLCNKNQCAFGIEFDSSIWIDFETMQKYFDGEHF